MGSHGARTSERPSSFAISMEVGSAQMWGGSLPPAGAWSAPEIDVRFLRTCECECACERECECERESELECECEV